MWSAGVWVWVWVSVASAARGRDAAPRDYLDHQTFASSPFLRYSRNMDEFWNTGADNQEITWPGLDNVKRYILKPYSMKRNSDIINALLSLPQNLQNAGR